MKTITTTSYQCEKCGTEYRAKQAALDCESRPMAEAMKEFWPVGLITDVNYRGDTDIALCVAKHWGQLSGYALDKQVKHGLNYSMWAIRPAGNNSLEGETCGNEDTYDIPSKRMIFSDMQLRLPQVKQLVEYLRSKGITPTRWDGERPKEIPACFYSESAPAPAIEKGEGNAL